MVEVRRAGGQPALVLLPYLESDDGLVLTHRDFDSHDYGKREAATTLGDVVDILMDSLKAVALDDAVKEIGADAEGFLLSPFERIYTIGRIKFPVEVVRNHNRPKLATVLTRLNGFLDDVLFDKGIEIRRDCVVNADGETYINTGYLLSKVDQWKGEPEDHDNAKRERSKNLISIGKWQDLEDAVLEHDLGIKSLQIFSNLKMYGVLSPANADFVYRARSLLYQINKFVAAFETKTKRIYGPAVTTEDKAEPSFEVFDDGSRARILVFLKSYPSYSDVLNALVKPREEGKNLNSSCGDVVILNELWHEHRDKFPYHHARRAGELSVNSEVNEHNQRLGITTIYRKNGERRYRVHLSKGTENLCVSVNDVLNTLNTLRKIEEDRTEPHVKIDYSRPIPSYLRQIS